MSWSIPTEDHAIGVTERFVREALANLKRLGEAEGIQELRLAMLPTYVQSAALIYAADRLDMVLKELADQLGGVSGAQDVVGSALQDIAISVGRLSSVACAEREARMRSTPTVQRGQTTRRHAGQQHPSSQREGNPT